MKFWLLLVLLFMFSFVSADTVDICDCDMCGTTLNYVQTRESYNYCIIDSDCTQSFVKNRLFSSTLTSGIGWYGPGLDGPLYEFSSPNTCTTPGGCVSPVYLNSESSYGMLTIPANTYPVGPVFVGEWNGCGGGGEVYGFNWNYIEPFGEMPMYNADCATDEVCHVVSDRLGRLFYGRVAVSASQASNSFYEDTLGPNSILISDDSEVRGIIEFDIPANTFGPGEVSLHVYDLIEGVPISGQSGGSAILSFTGPGPEPLSITVFPESCYVDVGCAIAITVDGEIDFVNHEIGFYGSGSLGPIGLEENGVEIYSNVIYYTLPANFFNAGELTVSYSDFGSGELDSEIIIMLSPGCVPDGCNGHCPSGCTAVEDPDCSLSGCCGDLLIDPSENCEIGMDSFPVTGDDDLNGENCTTQGFDLGVLFCAADCSFDNSFCDYSATEECGDNIIQTPNDDGLNEICDGIDLGGEDCTTQGFDFGTLDCLTDCTGFDTGGCDSPTPDPAPIAGPDEYLVYGSCVDDNSGDQYGVSTWTLYAGNGSVLNTSSSLCVLYSSEVPFSGVFGILLFLVLIFGFYFKESYLNK